MGKAKSGVRSLIGRQVVMDTAESITFLGTLREIDAEGFWLENADIRDRNEGHQTKEHYVCEARMNGIRPNRQKIYVFARRVISISALEDVVAD